MILYNLIFLVIGLIIWVVIVYTRAYTKYENKKEIDKCYKERKEFKELSEKFKNKVREQEEEIKNLKKELEKSKREIMEKNKYLAENSVIVERLTEVKKLSDQISQILIDYDKDTIKHLLESFKKWELCELEKKIEENNSEEEKSW